MAKPKSIYALKGIFSNLLTDTGKSKFLIPTYQRGYKWASGLGKGQVDILLKDLHNAFNSNSSRYYLQFLTLKAKDDELEVIDGQQRLTTLTILFCVMSYSQSIENEQSFVCGKLKYQTRQNFIEKYIYNDVGKLLKTTSWENFRSQNSEHDNQDVYFIYHAAKAIYNFIREIISENAGKFYDYLSNNVFLIVNLLEENLKSEKIFINVNKGVKLNDEDLVKGLLITKLPLDYLNQKYRTTEVEINELRTNLGRQWDDLSNWATRENILAFFKADTGSNRLEWLIRLAYPEIEVGKSEHTMFDYFDNLYTHKNVDAGIIFSLLRATKMTLNDWYTEPEIANLLGFVLHASKSHRKELIWRELQKNKTKSAIIKVLKERTLELLPLNEHGKLKTELTYEEHSDELFNVFLILDVAKFFPLNGRAAAPYNFGKISSGNWSLEHIFPQNAKDFKGVENLSKNDLSIIKELIPVDRNNVKADQPDVEKQTMNLYDRIQSSTESCVVLYNERELIAKLLSDNAPGLHRIGNLALLERNINSGLSNHYFNEKRKILVRKISEGKFVPFHTYDVFSKLIFATDSGLHAWSKHDILRHEEYILKQILMISEYLNTHEN